MTKLQIKLKSFDSYYIFLAEKSILALADVLGISHYVQANAPTKVKKITVLRSPHIDKNSREQFQLKRHKKILEFSSEKSMSVSIFLQLLKQFELSGLEMEFHLSFFD